MTLIEADIRVHQVRSAAEDECDYGKAHLLERNLWRDVLEAISAGEPAAATLATMALETTRIEFPRLFA